MDKVAIGRVVLTNRDHVIALLPLENGLMGTLLRYPYEVRREKEYFEDIQDVKFRGADRGCDTSPEVSLIDDPEAVQSWRLFFTCCMPLQGDQTIPATRTDEECLTA